MTKIKLCGLKRPCDIEYANDLNPEYIGFVFAQGSKRYVSPETAKDLRQKLKSGIIPVGVFVDEEIENIVDLLNRNIIGAVQLHGNEDESYIQELRARTANTIIIKAYRIETEADIEVANHCSADYVLLDSGGGTGVAFDWSLIKNVHRAYFLAGGLNPENVKTAVCELQPYGVDASSSLETEGFKDRNKMTAFVSAVRERKD